MTSQTSSYKYSSYGGIIIFDSNIPTKVVILTTPSGKLNFPKGDITDETFREGIARHLYQQTGITLDQLMIVFQLKPLTELNERGNVSVQYYVGYTKDPNLALTLASTETFTTVKWMPFNTVFDSRDLLLRRKDILRKAFLRVRAFEAYDGTKFLLSDPDKSITLSAEDQEFFTLGKLNLILHNTLKNASEKKLDPDRDGSVKLHKLFTHLPEYTTEQIRKVIASRKHYTTTIKNKTESNKSEEFVSLVQESKKQDRSELILKPEEFCVRGVTEHAYQTIQKHGYIRMPGLKSICFYNQIPKDKEVILVLDMQSAMKDGIKFFKTDDNIMLTRGIDGVVPIKYIKEIMRVLPQEDNMKPDF